VTRWWMLASLGGCAGAIPPPGVVGSADSDGDGWTVSDGDCDDRDEETHPQAVDWPGDDVDQDCDGADDTALAMAGVQRGDLVVTEVMMDPVGVSADLGEWFELANTTEVDIDLDGLLVRDLTRDDFVVALPTVIGAEGYLVLGIWADPVQNGGVPVDYEYEADFGLTNTEDAIVLLFDGMQLEEVGWDATYPLRAGAALTLGDDLGVDDNDVADVWCLPPEDAVYGPGGLGSPGVENNDCPGPFDGLTAAELTRGDLVITEVLQNPAQVSGDLGEWFEVHNSTGQPVDLDGVTVTDGDDAFTVSRSHIVSAGGYAVFGAFADPAINGGTPVDVAWEWDFALANSGQAIELRFGTLLIDRVVYDNGLTFPDPEGASMSLSGDVLDGDDNDAGGSWCAATTPYGAGDLGTPGQANPLCAPVRQGPELLPGDIVITEIMKQPVAVDGDDGEWFEVANTTAELIDLVGLQVHDDGGDSHVIAGSVRIEPGALAVLGTEVDPLDNGGVALDYSYALAVRLGNVGDELVLSFGGIELDAVRYDAVSWPNTPGTSLSLDPARGNATDNDDPASWCAATTPFGDGDLGTPGAQNPGC